MLKRWHFLMLKDTCHLSLQDSISWRPLWSLHSSSTTSTMLYNKQSSPKRRIFENMMLLAISPIYMRGPKKVPCATPDLTFTGAEATLLQNALRAFSKPSRYLLTQTFHYPILLYLCEKALVGHSVKGLAKTDPLSAHQHGGHWSSLHLGVSSRRVISCVSHDRPFLKPCWKSTKMLLASQCYIICLKIVCSRTLQQTEVSDTGR